MYTALRDLFVDVLGYPKTAIVVDTASMRGRPDVTVFAPGGASRCVERADSRGFRCNSPTEPQPVARRGSHCGHVRDYGLWSLGEWRG